MAAVWQEAGQSTRSFPPLTGDHETDVAIIGGGITGLTLARELAGAGLEVVVLEANRMGQSNTGNSTGNLYSTLASGLAPLRHKWGDAVAEDVVRARSQALDRIEALVKEHQIECQFARRPLYRIQTDENPSAARSLHQERKALQAAGLTTLEVDNKLFGFDVHRGLKLDNQAQLNPLRYAQGLAGAVADRGVTLHEQTSVRQVDHKQGLLQTDAGQIRARHIVHATHTPKGIDLLQTGLLPSREYCVSAPLTEGARLPEAILWVLDPFHSVRGYRCDGRDYVMAVGEKHEVGHGEPGDASYRRLEAYLRQHFSVGALSHRWSAQQFSSPDGLPFIGRMHGADNAYVATGFGADGLVWGTLAGMLISDLIQGRQNDWQARFDARRFTPAKSFKGWARENMKVSGDLLKDYLAPEKLKALADVGPGEGRVLSVHGEKLAVYRKPTGELAVVSAICPHMKCVVHFNGAERTWDCPCHGSRFTTEGAVIEGPAYHPLQQRLPVPAKTADQQQRE